MKYKALILLFSLLAISCTTFALGITTEVTVVKDGIDVELLPFGDTVKTHLT